MTMPIGLALVVAVAGIHRASGYELSFSIFYLIPVSYVTWYAGRSGGWIMAIVSAATWGLVNYSAGAQYSAPLIAVWNSTVHLGFFALAVSLLSEIRNSQELRALALTDSVTGAHSVRSLYSEINREIERVRRYGGPFTFAYIDLDHFKHVNDTLGHAAGDDVLRTVAGALRCTLREVDSVGRIGGDEFGVVMPETDEEMAAIALVRARAAISAAMSSAAPTVPGLGATVGAVVFSACPQSADAAVHLADALMYEGKRSERGVVRLAVYSGNGQVSDARTVRPGLTY
jgi:diguanylate cyclase (GGDEF)-like protein